MALSYELPISRKSDLNYLVVATTDIGRIEQHDIVQNGYNLGR
jgi:hypothetical protein